MALSDEALQDAYDAPFDADVEQLRGIIRELQQLRKRIEAAEKYIGEVERDFCYNEFGYREKGSIETQKAREEWLKLRE